MREYPNHVCACEDDDLSQVRYLVISDNGLWVQVTCGAGCWRSITRAQWDEELARRARAEQKREGKR